MRKEELYRRVSEILQDTFGIEPERISMDARLADDLDIDSIDAVDLIVQLKPLLGGNLKPEAFKTVRTIADVIDALMGMMQAPADAPVGA